MASAQARQSQRAPLRQESPGLRRAAPQRREPVWQDYLLFFIGIPVALAVLFSMVGTRLTNGMPYLDSLLYLVLHMFTAWWPVCLGVFFIKFCFR